MNERIRKLAEQAGFMLWQDEDWNPGDVVDWAGRYDQELVNFYNLIVQQAAEACRRVGQLEQNLADGEMYARAVLEQFMDRDAEIQ